MVLIETSGTSKDETYCTSSKKYAVLTREEVNKFVLEAPDEIYVYDESCYDKDRDELTKITVADITYCYVARVI